MFPYSTPRDTGEVREFMSALGAKSTAYETLLYPELSADDRITRIEFYAPAYIDHGGSREIATYRQRVDDNYVGNVPPRWVDDLGSHLPASNIIDTELYPWHNAFERLDKIATLLASQGYERHEVIDIITLYEACAEVWDLHEDTTPEELFRCAAINRLDGLAAADKLDAAARLIPVEELVTLLAGGATYPLIKDMFPHED